MTYGWHTSTYVWRTDDIRVHTNDMRMTYEWHTDDIRVHTSNIWMTTEYIRVTYGWHKSGIRMTYEYIQIKYKRIQITCKWRVNDIRNIKPYKDLEFLDRNFQNYLWWKHCFWRLQMIFCYYFDSHYFDY